MTKNIDDDNNIKKYFKVIKKKKKMSYAKNVQNCIIKCDRK